MKMNPMGKPPTDGRLVLLVDENHRFYTADYGNNDWGQGNSVDEDKAPVWCLFGVDHLGFTELEYFVDDLSSSFIGWIECPAIDIEETGA